MELEVVHHHNLSGVQARNQKVLHHVSLEGCPIGGSFDAHRLSYPFRRKRGDQRYVFAPVVARCFAESPLTFGCPGVKPPQSYVGAAFVYK